MILAVQYPVHLKIDSTAPANFAELGQLTLDDVDPGAGGVGAFFTVGLVAGDPHDVVAGVGTRGESVASQDMNAGGLTMTFQNGLLVSLT